MRLLFNLLSIAVSVYSFIIIIRFILSWFRGSVRIPDFLVSVTEPYINWFRRFEFLRIGYLDISPIAALAVLTVLGQVFSTLARYGVIRLGIILAIMVQVVQSAVSFFLVLLLIVIILRLIAYMTNQDIYGPFWKAIDTISQPVLYRMNRILFRDKIVNFRTSLIVCIAVLAVISLVLRIFFALLVGILIRLPI